MASPVKGNGTIPPGQLRLLALLCRYIDEHCIPPTVRQLARMDGKMTSHNAAYGQLRLMARKGLVEWNTDEARTLRPLVRIEVWK